MEPAIEEFNLLYPNYLISSIDGSVEVVETCPRSDLDFRRLVVTGCMGYVFPREFAADSVAFYGQANSRPPMMYNSSCQGTNHRNFITVESSDEYIAV